MPAGASASPFASAAPAGLVFALGLAEPRGAAGTPLGCSQKPNFVVVQTDDETLDQLYAAINWRDRRNQATPYTLLLLANRGKTFNRDYVPYPLCCPSRVSLLTGRYAHTHNVRGNVPPNGGYTGFKAPRRPTPTTSPPGCRARATDDPHSVSS